MPNIKKIKQTMVDKGISNDIIEGIACSGVDIVAFVDQMDKALSYEQCLGIMEEQGCYKTERVSAPFREFGKKYKDIPIEEKVMRISELDTIFKYQCSLEPDGSLSVSWAHGNEGDYNCLCTTIKKAPKTAAVSRTYCGCCGGHARYHLQHALGVELHLFDIVSSPISSGGKEYCKFVFKIIE